MSDSPEGGAPPRASAAVLEPEATKDAPRLELEFDPHARARTGRPLDPATAKPLAPVLRPLPHPAARSLSLPGWAPLLLALVVLAVGAFGAHAAYDAWSASRAALDAITAPPGTSAGGLGALDDQAAIESLDGAVDAETFLARSSTFVRGGDRAALSSLVRDLRAARATRVLAADLVPLAGGVAAGRLLVELPTAPADRRALAVRVERFYAGGEPIDEEAVAAPDAAQRYLVVTLD